MMKLSICSIRFSTLGIALSLALAGCVGDPLVSGVDPFAPMIFKEGTTAMPLNPPNKASLQPFYVSRTTVFKFAIDTNSIMIGADGVTRYIVVITNPSGENQAQYEGIRCDSAQWRIYGNFANQVWKENPLSTWRNIDNNVVNRYQAALAQRALCNFSSQEKNIAIVVKALKPENFTGKLAPSDSYGMSPF